MKIKMTMKYLRISPRKLNRVIREIVGKKVNDAINILNHLPQHSAKVILKVVNSARSNAINNYKLSDDNILIDEGWSGQAAIMKRFTPMSKGRAGAIQKKLSHVSITIKEGSNNGAKN